MRTTRAFTLVEVLVGIAILSLLLGILLPVIAGARSKAWLIACGARQRDLHMGAMDYAARDQGRLPGVNTTGRPYLGNVERLKTLAEPGLPETPTTTFDWISPSVGASRGFSTNRAERTRQIFADIACPAAHDMNDQVWGWAPDRQDHFERVLQRDGFPQISYLAPASFMLAGPGRSPARYRRWGWRGPAMPPGAYLPRLDRVGANLAGKIFIADGTRFLTQGGVLDFDITLSPEYFGSFTSSTPIYEASTAYGERPNNPEFAKELAGGRRVSGDNRRLSYRHDGRMSVAYFDGHIGVLSEEESKSNAAPWYPTGSVFTGVRATDGALARHAEGEELP